MGGPRPEGNGRSRGNPRVGPGVMQAEDETMRRASLAGILAAAVLATGCLVEIDKVEEEGGDQVLVWLR